VNLAEQIQHEMVQATKSREKGRLSALRLIRAALQNRQIEKRGSLSDVEVLDVLSSLVKRAKESIDQFRLGKREDLVAKEEGELQVILSFMPLQMGQEEIREQVRAIIGDLGAQGPKDLGAVMRVAMESLKGKADGRVVNEMARELLSSQTT
jgi:hypothetical protein